MKLIINADDLGIDRAVNEAIFELIERGRITSATLLANGPAFGACTRRVGDYPQASFGVHLNLTQFSPLTRSDALAELLDDSGCFRGDVRKVKLQPHHRDAIVDEWCAQIDKVRDHGIAVSHLDSHHHLHTAPSLFSVLKRVQRRSGISRVRTTKNLYATPQPALFRTRKRAWAIALRYYVATRTTDGFTSFATFMQMDAPVLRRYRTLELMTHPGDERNAEEAAILMSDWLPRRDLQIELMSYNEL